MQKCTKQIEVGLNEGPPVDGYCWRKYGQKDILDSKHPRYLINDHSLSRFDLLYV